MSALIISNSMDTHAYAVKWALARYDFPVDFLCVADFPRMVTATYSSESDDFQFHGNGFQERNYSVVWHRRFGTVVPHEELDETDVGIAAKIGRDFLISFSSCAKKANWINDLAAAARAERKAFQLSLATEVGLKVPETIISNDVSEIRRFLGRGFPCIVKSLMPLNWLLEDIQIVLNTTRIDVADLWDKVAVEACPMIYQREISKDLEYRIVVFGAEVVCVEITPNASMQGALDWRDVVASERKLRQVDCPPQLMEAIRNFMAKAQLLHGSFDFVRGVDGQFYFLEVNQQGQFLWIEQEIPELHLLDRMASFIASGGHADFKYAPSAMPATFADYKLLGQAEADLTDGRFNHIYNVESFTIQEGKSGATA